MKQYLLRKLVSMKIYLTDRIARFICKCLSRGLQAEVLTSLIGYVTINKYAPYTYDSRIDGGKYWREFDQFFIDNINDDNSFSDFIFEITETHP